MYVLPFPKHVILARTLLVARRITSPPLTIRCVVTGRQVNP